MPPFPSAPIEDLWPETDAVGERTFVRHVEHRNARIRALALSFGAGSVAIALAVLAVEVFSPPPCDQVVLITVQATGAATTQLVCR